MSDTNYYIAEEYRELLANEIKNLSALLVDAGHSGDSGRGVHFENEVFVMKPYCYCDEPECPQCGHEAANFIHKPSGLAVGWYKYLGRGMKFEFPEAWKDKNKRHIIREVFSECIASIRPRETSN